MSCKDCSKKVLCPGGEDAVLDEWFTYADKQVLIFKVPKICTTYIHAVK